ncbi:hypothetical protein SUGI_0562940 [Cryptomeria japonica]|nr:hypothetical protein SUGI_0562940 [Cryptomeria japonica]
MDLGDLFLFSDQIAIFTNRYVNPPWRLEGLASIWNAKVTSISAFYDVMLSDPTCASKLVHSKKCRCPGKLEEWKEALTSPQATNPASIRSVSLLARNG